jgi:two-component sensor histidine kinase
MSKYQLTKLLTHPFFIGFVITVILTIAFMPDISKYKVDVMDKRYRMNYVYFYSDLDGDQNSEEIEVNSTPAMLKILIHQGKGVKEQYNLRSERLGSDFLYTEDYNNDGLKEIFLLTLYSDSIFLSIIDPFHNQDFIVKERLISYHDTISFIGEYPSAYFLGLTDSDSGKNILFALSAGFSKQPRKVYSYNINKDELNVSPLIGVSIGYPSTIEYHEDSIPVILLSTNAVGNYDSYVPYTDQSAWLMAFDKDLKFLFDPVEFPEYPSSLILSSFTRSDSLYIVALHEYYGTDTIQSGLYLYNINGDEILSRPIKNIEMNRYFMDVGISNGSPRIFIIEGNNSVVRIFDENLKEINKYSIPDVYINGKYFKEDIDLDGSEEYILQGRKPGSFVIFRNDFKYPVVVDLGEEFYFGYSTYLIDGKPYLFAQGIDVECYLDYRVNHFYYIKYPLLIISYLAISVLILLIFRLQKYRAERDYKAKRKMNELQILSLKNQIEPHFTFNILNSIGSLYTTNADPLRAYNMFVQYSNLLRSTIKNSDKVSISIEEELDFVNTYVELEQFRSNKRFNYQVDIEDDVDLSTPIPRMLIHTFVENAIKHGVQLAKEDPLLEVKITRNKHSHHIEIRDNGPGLNSKTDSKVLSTGKGLKIIDEMIDLFYQLEGSKITYTLEDISTRDPAKQGTLARITIPG